MSTEAHGKLACQLVWQRRNGNWVIASFLLVQMQRHRIISQRSGKKMHSLKKQGKSYASLQQKSRLRITPFWSLLQIRNSEFFKCELTAPRITAVNPAVLDGYENLKYRFWQHLHGFPLQWSYWGGYELPFCKMDNLRNVAILRKRTCRHYILLFCYCKASQFTKTKQKTRLGFTEMGKSKALLDGVSQ